MELEHPPLDEDIEAEPKREVEPEAAHAALDERLAEVVTLVGEETVADAMGQVVTGRAEPEALLAWIDDLREIRRPTPVVVDDPAPGFLHDFAADTEQALATDAPEGTEAAPDPPPAPHADRGIVDVDPDYFFTPARRRSLEDLDEADVDQVGGDDNDKSAR
jgi:hypothetical protein